MDDLVPLHRPRPRGPHEGRDGTGSVCVRLDDAARDARVVLDPGWRSRVGTTRWGAAVLEAFGAAVTARLAAWAAAPPAPPDPVPPGPLPTGPVDLDAAAAAWRDLREFQVRLAARHAAPVVVADAGGRVRVTVRGGRPVAVEPDAAWSATAADADLADAAGVALRAALAAVADEAAEAAAEAAGTAAGAARRYPAVRPVGPR